LTAGVDFVDDILRVSLLLDFYGNLLTKKQQEMLKFHYDEDLSLAEIAEQHGISRAAVQDSLRRGLQQLQAYEAKLGLIERFTEQSRKVQELRALLDKAAGIVLELMP
jgi:hypothetical protein